MKVELSATHDLVPPIVSATAWPFAERSPSTPAPTSSEHRVRALLAGGDVFRGTRYSSGAGDRSLCGDLFHVRKRAAKDLAGSVEKKRRLATGVDRKRCRPVLSIVRQRIAPRLRPLDLHCTCGTFSRRRTVYVPPRQSCLFSTEPHVCRFLGNRWAFSGDVRWW